MVNFNYLSRICSTLLAVSGCQTLLELERAKLDHELVTETQPTSATPADDITSAPHLPSDAGSTREETSAGPAPQCEGFDNSRVELLGPDGTLPPLPEAPPAP